jgi:hypothetical protein
METCSVTNCDNPGTQRFLVKEMPENGLVVGTAITVIVLDENGVESGEVTFCTPGSPTPLCAEHYDLVVGICRRASEKSDDPGSETFREITKLNS